MLIFFKFFCLDVELMCLQFLFCFYFKFDGNELGFSVRRSFRWFGFEQCFWVTECLGFGYNCFFVSIFFVSFVFGLIVCLCVCVYVFIISFEMFKVYFFGLLSEISLVIVVLVFFVFLIRGYREFGFQNRVYIRLRWCEVWFVLFLVVT